MIYKNKKTGNTYLIGGEVTNTTNEQDGQIMIMYQSTDLTDDTIFVREKTEFFEKFVVEDDIIYQLKKEVLNLEYILLKIGNLIK